MTFALWLDPHKLPPCDKMGPELPPNYVARLQALLIAVHCAFKANIDRYMPPKRANKTHIWESRLDAVHIKLVFSRESVTEKPHVELAVLKVTLVTDSVRSQLLERILQHAVAVNCRYTDAVFVLPNALDTFDLRTRVENRMEHGPNKFAVSPEDWADDKIESLLPMKPFLIPRGPLSKRLGALYDICYRKCYMEGLQYPVTVQPFFKKGDEQHPSGEEEFNTMQALTYLVKDINQTTKEFQELCVKDLTQPRKPFFRGLMRSEPFLFVDLDEWMLPSAHDLNQSHAQGKNSIESMAKQRDARFMKENGNGHVWRDRDLNKKGQYVYKKAVLQRWSHSFIDIEDFFQKKNFMWISYNYVSDLQALFRRMFYACYAQFWMPHDEKNKEAPGSHSNEPMLWDAISDVLYVKLKIVSGQKLQYVMVEEIVVRDCAEGFGFFRLALAEIARLCQYFGVDMMVHNFTHAMEYTLMRAYPDAASTSHWHPKDDPAGEYLRFKPDDLKQQPLRAAFGVSHLVNRNARRKTPGFQISDSIHLKIVDLVKGWIYAQRKDTRLRDVYAAMKADCKELAYVKEDILEAILESGSHVMWDSSSSAAGVVCPTSTAEEEVKAFFRVKARPALISDQIKTFKGHTMAFSGEQIFDAIDSHS
jgi:hypothetical protein